MLWAQQDTAKAAQSTAKSAKFAARAAAATAFYSRKQAQSAQLSAESAIRQEGQLGAILNQQQLARSDAERHAASSERLQMEMLESQRKIGWMQYRNSPDGQEFAVWARTAAAVLDRIDSLNEVWLNHFRAVVHRTVTEWEWHAERSGDYLPLNHTSKNQLRGVLPGALKFVGKHGAANLASKALLSNQKWVDENNAIRLHWHQLRMSHFGCDPVLEPDQLPPGWAVGNQNWLLPMQIREFFEYAYTNYPSADSFPRDLVKPVLRDPGAILPTDLAPILDTWHRGQF